MSTVAVTGATGQFGRVAVQALLDRGETDVVAVVRDASRASSLAQQGVQVRVADYDAPEALRTALAGVDRLLLVSGSEVGRRAAQHANVLGAAQAAGVQRVVYTSLLRADSNTMPLGEEHRATEQLLADSGIATVVLRNGWYVENFTSQVAGYQAVGAVVGAVGGARVAAAARADYAEAAAVALVDDRVTPGTYELAGTPFTMPELASALGEALGQPLPYQDVTLEEYRAGLLAAGLDEGTAGFVTALEAGTAQGELDGDPAVLQQLLGRPVTGLHAAVAAALR